VPPLERPPEEWKSAGEPMTDSQASFLKRLSTDAGEEFDATLSKAAASRRIDELLNRGKGKGGSAASAPSKRPRKSAASRSAKVRAKGGMSEAQSAYLQELAEEEGGDFDPDLTKDEGARRIAELLVKQMARRSPTEPPF
jgi:ribosomal protein L12E/L44/L45/RPP1/RPP2